MALEGTGGYEGRSKIVGLSLLKQVVVASWLGDGRGSARFGMVEGYGAC